MQNSGLLKFFGALSIGGLLFFGYNAMNNTNAQSATKSSSHSISSGVVKKSNSNICHAPSSRYYNQTKYYTSYDSLSECLDSGGRLPLR